MGTDSSFIERTLSGVLQIAARSVPAMVVTGPRQSGKTTLVRRLFGRSHAYCSLDDPAVRNQALNDPGLLLIRFPPPVIFDEIQYATQLLHYIKRDIDENRSHAGRYVITGSQIFPVMQGVTESLAGRAAVTTLLSLSLLETAGHPGENLPWKRLLVAGSPVLESRDLIHRIHCGGYAEPFLSREMDVNLWHSSYVQTYLERDVRTLRAVTDLGDFQRFLFALAARTTNLINFQDLARDLGVTGKTVKAWVSVLEASGQILTLKSYHTSLGKRLVKRPKVYFLDTGTLAYLLGVTQKDQLTGIAAGPLFESAVLGQLHRLFLHRGEVSRLYFWRTSAGHEVDFVIEDGGTLIPIEAKLTSYPTAKDASSIIEFQRLFGDKSARGLVVCLCKERFPLTRNVDAVPVGSF